MSEKFARAVVTTMAFAVISAIGIASLPVKSHTTGAVERTVRVINEVVPQGWGFFTRDPREPITQAWVRDGSGEWLAASRGPNATLRNAFGLDRSSRLDEYDVSQVLGGKDIDGLWVDCTGNTVAGCARRAATQEGVQHWEVEGFDLRLCGDVVLLDASPVPLDFAGLRYDPPKKAIQASIRCKSAGGSS